MIPKEIYISTAYDWNISLENPDYYLAKYVDLSQLWHDVSEMPTKEALILYLTTLGRYDVIFYGGNKEEIWEAFIKDYGVANWAYINDLLPKGGEK